MNPKNLIVRTISMQSAIRPNVFNTETMDIHVRSSLRKKGANYHAVFYSPDRHPSQKWVALGTKDKRVAEMRLAEMRKREAAGQYNPWASRPASETETLATAVKQYLHDRSTRRLSPATIRADEGALRALQSRLPANVWVKQVERRQVEALIHDVLERGGKESTARTYQARYKAFFGWCLRQGFITAHPLSGMEMQRVGRKAPRFLSRAQVDHLIGVVRGEEAFRREGAVSGNKHTWVPIGGFEWVVDVITVAVGTGLRLAELCHMQWSWVHLEEGFVRVQAGPGFRPKSHHERMVFFGSDVAAVLGRLRSAHPTGTGYVFQGRLQENDPSRHLDPVYVSKRVKRFMGLAGLPSDFTFHTLRHTYASWLAMSGGSPFAIKELLGHADLKTTERYAHLSPETLRTTVRSAFEGASRNIETVP